MSERFEMRVSAELLARLDAARGSLPRATFIKSALLAALEPAETGPDPDAVAERPRAVPGQWSRVTRLGGS